MTYKVLVREPSGQCRLVAKTGSQHRAQQAFYDARYILSVTGSTAEAVYVEETNGGGGAAPCC